jgi:starvation-inducible DNA-binding protein
MRKLLCAALFIGILGTVALIVGQEMLVTQPAAQPKGLGLEPNIGIATNNRDAVCNLLNTLLSDEYVLYVKTQNYHWNVTGLMFNDLHQFFGKQYAELANIVDLVAERVRILGGKTFGTLQEFIEHARIKEFTGTVPDYKEMLKNLLADHESIIRSVRAGIDATSDEFEDMGTNNFLSDLITKHEKMAWMLRAYVS